MVQTDVWKVEESGWEGDVQGNDGGACLVGGEAGSDLDFLVDIVCAGGISGIGRNRGRGS